MMPSFSFSEEFALGDDSYSWRLKDNEIRFRGWGHYHQLVHQRIPASDEQIEKFFAIATELQVWDWRAKYDLSEADYCVLDGSSWKFQAEYEQRSCRSYGGNAYPSLEDPQCLAREGEGRWGLLHDAIYDCFNIPHYIELAKQYRDG